MNRWVRAALVAGVLLCIGLGIALWQPRTHKAEEIARSGPASRRGSIENREALAPIVNRAPVEDRISARTQNTPLDGQKEDAANLYKNALVLYNALTKEEKEIIRTKSGVADPAAATALLEKIQPILALLRRAQTEGLDCDWGINVDSVDSPMPQITAVMDLVKTARWAAGVEFPADPAMALGDLEAGMKVGHSVSDQMLIGWIVSGVSDAAAIETIQSNIGSLTPDMIRRSLELLSGASPASDLQEAMLREASAMGGLISKFENPATREDLLNAVATTMSSEQAEQLSKLTAAQVEQQVAWLKDVEQAFASKVGLSDAEFTAWWNQVNSEADANLLARAVLPELARMRDSLQGALVKNAMAASALTILSLGAQDGLGSVVDPTTGRPFLYTPIPGGFELRSPFVQKGKAISMQFLTAGGAP